MRYKKNQKILVCVRTGKTDGKRTLSLKALGMSITMYCDNVITFFSSFGKNNAKFLMHVITYLDVDYMFFVRIWFETTQICIISKGKRI